MKRIASSNFINRKIKKNLNYILEKTFSKRENSE
jgi:hypothetical protein